MVNRVFTRVRRPVRRQDAEFYLLLTLLSFAASVVLTRLFLKLTGYPQVGGGSLHIAHVLWGGLLLFIAATLPLVFANRWVYSLGGVLSGVGVGLFIDEVGKFITRTNDYLYPAAAPIIYAFFLMTVLFWVQIRRPPSDDPRAELYHALEGMEDVLDRDLDPLERAELEARLRHVATHSDEPDLVRLAQALLDFLSSDAVLVTPEMPSFVERYAAWARAAERRYLNRRRLRFGLTVGFAILGLPALIAPIPLLWAAFSPAGLWQNTVQLLINTGVVHTPREIALYLTRILLEGAAGLPLLLAAIFLLLGRDRYGVLTGYFGLLFSLTVVNLLVFYFDQFGAVVKALVQFWILLATMYYRRSYLVQRTPPRVATSALSSPQ